MVVPLARQAQSDAARDRAEDGDRGRWARLQVLGANAAGVGLSFGCVALDGGIPCLTPGLLGGSAVHAAHGNYGRAALSLAAHIVFPGLFGALGARATPPSCPTEEPRDSHSITPPAICTPRAGPGGMVGVWVGVVAAVALDAALAYDDVRPPRPETAARRAPAVLPTMTIGNRDAVFGVEGRF